MSADVRGGDTSLTCGAAQPRLADREDLSGLGGSVQWKHSDVLVAGRDRSPNGIVGSRRLAIAHVAAPVGGDTELSSGAPRTNELMLLV